MAKDDKINIKLEVFKDKNSGKLSIKAHFNQNAPNIFKEKDDFLWMPTVEEKDLLNEAFKLMPAESTFIPSKETIPKSEEPKEIKSSTEFQPPVDEPKPTEIHPLEKSEDSSTFEVTDDDIKTDDISKGIESEDIPPEIDEEVVEEPKADESKNLEEGKDKAIIVEADAEAIDAALKKRIKRDESIVEADEQTIIDKVLSQKKKGKWSKR